MYDIYLPIVVLTPAIAYFIAPKIDEATKLVISDSSFAAN
jgi:hypothetical protein